MPDKDKSPKKQEPQPKPNFSDKVDFGAVRHIIDLKKKILKMNDKELESYSKEIGVPFNGDKTAFLAPALALYKSQQ